MLISVEHLTKHQNVKCIVKDVNMVVEEHDKIACIGVNGTGKTTLLNILAGVETYEEGKLLKQKGLRISYLRQDPKFCEEETILYQVMHMDKDIQEYEAKAMLGKLGIFDTTLSVAQLSGGQRKRVALAKALLKPCDLLILDEPTNHLDNGMIEWLENYLIKFNRAVVMVTHDRYFLERVCTKMIEIDQGQLFCYGVNYSQYVQLKAERMEILQANERKRQSILRKELEWVRAGVKARGTKSKERMERFTKLSALEKPKDNESIVVDTLMRRLGRKTIEIERVEKGYHETLFHDFSYSFTRCDRVGILGPNGCGKTTLLHVLTKEIQPDSGSVVHGETIRIGYFKQGFEDMDMDKKVIDYIRDIGNEIETLEGRFSASQMLERFLFDASMQYTRIARLSGGERRRLYLLKVLMSAPNMLFLDEPTNDLDIQTLQILEDYLDNFQGAILVVSHDRYFLDRICDKLFVFTGDKKITQFIGGYSAYMEFDMGCSGIRKQEEKKKSEKTHHIPRMTSKEKKELERAESDIDELQKEVAEVDRSMEVYAQDFVKLQELSKKRIFLEASMEAVMERWMYLIEKQQEIHDAKNKV